MSPARAPTWWLDEAAHAGAEHLDPDYIAGYERKAKYDPGPDTEALIAAGLHRDATVLDLGAGTGAFSRAVSGHCRRVVAVDPSPAMCVYQRERLREAGIDNVEVVRAGFLSLDPGLRADFTFTRNALHQVPDFWKAQALRALHRRLAPGGRLRVCDLFYDFEPADTESALEAWMAGTVADPAEGYTAADLATHVRTEFATFSWLFEALLERTGFRIESRAFRRSIYGAYDCVRVDAARS